MSNPGFVYILVNRSMPGLVKIGRTGRDVDLRASELWQTGVPTRFEVYASQRTTDCVQLEAYMHGSFHEQRISKSREFFAVDPDTASEKLTFWAEMQAVEAGQEFLDDNFGSMMVITHRREYVSGLAIDRLANETGHDAQTIADAMGHLTADEIAPAIVRSVAARREEQREMLRQMGIPEGDWEGLIND